MKLLPAFTIGGLVLISGLGCTQTRHGFAIPNAGVALPPMQSRADATRRAGAPAEPLAIGGGSQTVLIHTTLMDDPYYEYRKWGRAFVVVIDGPLTKGRVEVTPENGRLVENTPWAPPRRPYIGLEGSINIISVSAKGILAECALHNSIYRTGEPVYSLRGMYTFDVGEARAGDLNRCGIDWEIGAAAAPAVSGEK